MFLLVVLVALPLQIHSMASLYQLPVLLPPEREVLGQLVPLIVVLVPLVVEVSVSPPKEVYQVVYLVVDRVECFL